MDVSGIAKLATSIADTGYRQDVAVAVLKRAQQVDSAVATQLVDALQSASPAQNLPANLGRNINTTA
jgi:hypothetical protein